MPLARTRPRRRGRANEESPPAIADKAATPEQAQQMPAYARGQGTVAGVPLFDGAPVQTQPFPDQLAEPREEPTDERKTQAGEEENVAAEIEEKAVSPTVTQMPDVSGAGEELHTTAHSLTLQGQTDADYRSSFRTVGVRTTPGTGCEGCDAGDCVHVRGTLVSTYTVATTVTLPSVNDFPDLTPCQRRRVQSAITNVLAPHEQQHVRAFRTYNGTTRQPFDMTICRGAFDAAMQSMHDAEQSTRQAAAQALSNALDPFQFDVDLNCEEPRDAGPPRADAGAPVPQAATPGEEEVQS